MLAALCISLAVLTLAVPLASTVCADPSIPPHASTVLEHIRSHRGQPPPGYVGGTRFENRERRLPRGEYREYDVHPRVRGQNRGPERLVIEQNTGRAYYTADHYRTFIEVTEANVSHRNGAGPKARDPRPQPAPR